MTGQTNCESGLTRKNRLVTRLKTIYFHPNDNKGALSHKLSSAFPKEYIFMRPTPKIKTLRFQRNYILLYVWTGPLLVWEQCTKPLPARATQLQPFDSMIVPKRHFSIGRTGTKKARYFKVVLHDPTFRATALR